MAEYKNHQYNIQYVRPIDNIKLNNLACKMPEVIQKWNITINSPSSIRIYAQVHIVQL